jgi:Domain of unknown function (DUF5658)
MLHRYNASEAGKPSERTRLENKKTVPILKRRDAFASVTRLERRRGPDRRKEVLRALFYGSFNPRRRGPRREGERSVSAVDWHHPQWLAVAMIILLLSCADACLTLALMDQGAYEINPLMAPLVGGSPLAFTLVKIGLTAGGVVTLTVLARVRAFGRVPVSLVLYSVLAGYGLLLVYELRLLEATLLAS